MPGVPSGRGCDACRQQKKKCDQGKPACSRCTRLEIQCVGSGQRRFKFKEQNMGASLFQHENHTSSISRGARRQRKKHRSMSASASPKAVSVPKSSPSPALSPIDKSAGIRDALLHALEYDDLRYDLRCYGAFVAQVPQLLGVNEALDASVSALTAAHATLHIKPQPVDSLAKYVNALQALRKCLLDPAKALTIETMVAIYFVMICQSFMGRFDDTFMCHGRIMAHLLDILTERETVSELESEILCTLSVTVIIYSVLYPQIRVSPALMRLGKRWDFSVPKSHEEAATFEVLNLSSLMSCSEFLTYPENHYMEITYTYTRVKEEYRRLKQYMTIISAAGNASPLREIAHVNTTAAAYMILACLFNAILHTYHPGDEDLLREAFELDEDVLRLGENVMKYRPLGSNYMPCCLTAALVYPAPTKAIELQEMLTVYQSDFTDIRWLETAAWLRRKINRQCNQLDDHASTGVTVASVMAPEMSMLADLSHLEISWGDLDIPAVDLASIESPEAETVHTSLPCPPLTKGYESEIFVAGLFDGNVFNETEQYQDDEEPPTGACLLM